MDITVEIASESSEDDRVRARRAVARHATDADDARSLLAMLGLDQDPVEGTATAGNATLEHLEFLRDAKHRSGKPCIGCGKTTGTREQVELGLAEVRYASLGYCKKCRAEISRIEKRLS